MRLYGLLCAAPLNFVLVFIKTMNNDDRIPEVGKVTQDRKNIGDSKILPSVFMRKLHPEYYSDSSDIIVYELEQDTFEYHLDTITKRNQTHDFEIFCRKLCERTICPNLRPATGPEGGGDSKADTETFAVADEISQLFYVGEPNAGSERWAFAFSANERWTRKVNDDVKDIVGTGRPYNRIICVTSRFARAKTRAELEDSLTKKHGIPIEVHDRTWIVKEIIENNRKDLAFNYLGVGREVADTRLLGPNDYSRRQQLDDLEDALADPDRFRGMETQRVTEALIAAKLSRGLESPRIEVEGRFKRAKRLAQKDGTPRQRLEIQYETILTAFWWYDDFDLLNSSYEEFEATLRPHEHVKNVEFLSELAQLLVVSVIHNHLTTEECKFFERSDRLRRRLKVIARDQTQPNSALEASTLLLLWRLNIAFIKDDTAELPAIWSEFADVLERAKPMGEFDAERIKKIISTAGQVAGHDPEYNALVENLAVFVAQRKSEAEGARILVQRAQQLDFNQHFEMIRLLGKAIPKLSKREYDNELVDALNLLALAYRSAGLLWAARSSCLMATARIVSFAEEESELTLDMIPVIKLWAWLSVELGHLPDLLSAMELLSALLGALPQADEAKKKILDELRQIDLVLASHLLNRSDEDIGKLEALPGKLDRIPLRFSRAALLYSLGYENRLREEGSIPEDETGEGASELFSTLASQPVSKKMRGPIICNSEDGQAFETKVLGLSVRVSCSGSELSILVAELVVGAVEAFFATTLELDIKVMPHTEAFNIKVVEKKELNEPDFQVDLDRMEATLLWPSGKSPGDFNYQENTVRALMEMTATILAATCYSSNYEAVFEQLYNNELAQGRIIILTLTTTNYYRILGRPLSRLSSHIDSRDEIFSQRDRPELQDLKSDVGECDGSQATIVSHRTVDVSSVIDVHLWDRANWRGTGFFAFDANTPPIIALLFSNQESARKIFERWHERFGQRDIDEAIHLAIIRDVSAANPSHYEVLVTSSLPSETERRFDNLMMHMGRHLTVTPETSANLDRFLKQYERVASYFLSPAILKGSAVQPIMDLGILKHHLSVRNYSDIKPHDIEAIAFPNKFK